jgi:hypothetical protein
LIVVKISSSASILLFSLAACSSTLSPIEEGPGSPDASLHGDASVHDDASVHGDASKADGTDGATGGDDDVNVPPPDGAQTAESGPTSEGGSVNPGAPCGYKMLGHDVRIGTSIELCLPPIVCAPSETCPSGLGDCVNGQCVYKSGYQGLATLPEAWATQYCALKSGDCNGAVQVVLPLDVANAVAAKFGQPLCADNPSAPSCVGIVASPPTMVGNSQLTTDPATGQQVKNWGLGVTPASGLCYEIEGDGGKAIVAIMDRCGGWCGCGGASDLECGSCLNKSDMKPQCPCVGAAPPLYNQACPGSISPRCDWCANNNHPHFDLDDDTFAHVCGPQGPTKGSCKLKSAKYVACYPARPNWPN